MMAGCLIAALTYIPIYKAMTHFGSDPQNPNMFMLTLPFLLAMVVAALVAPSMFPDEVDYLTMVPLPITRRRIFAAKIIALTMFAGVLLLSLSFFAAISRCCRSQSMLPHGTPRTVVTPWPSQSLYTYSGCGALGAPPV